MDLLNSEAGGGGGARDGSATRPCADGCRTARRAAAHEARRDEPARRRRRGLRGVVRAAGRRAVARLRPRRRRGRDGRRDRRLVRGDGALPASARAADPPHRDHPEPQGRDRREPRRFVENEFLSDDVVLGKLESMGVARRLGEWLAMPEHAERLTAEVSVAARGVLTLLGDEDVEDVIENLARAARLRARVGSGDRAPRRSARGVRPAAHGDRRRAREGRGLARVAPRGVRQHGLRPPAALAPGFVDRIVDDRASREVRSFVRAVRDRPEASAADRDRPLPRRPHRRPPARPGR